jgi:hypothetical protein
MPEDEERKATLLVMQILLAGNSSTDWMISQSKPFKAPRVSHGASGGIAKYDYKETDFKYH